MPVYSALSILAFLVATTFSLNTHAQGSEASALSALPIGVLSAAPVEIVASGAKVFSVAVGLLAAGFAFGSRGATAKPMEHEAGANLVVRVDRGTVHASDDAPSRQISVAPGTTVRAMVATAIADAYLPSIAGGKATWIVESSGAGRGAETPNACGATLRPIAVCAQQWTEVKFLIDADVLVGTHFGETLPLLNLRYRCQAEPETVMRELQAANG